MDVIGYDPVGYWLCPLFYFESHLEYVKILEECTIVKYELLVTNSIIREFIKTPIWKPARTLRPAYETPWILVISHNKVYPQHKSILDIIKSDLRDIISYFENVFLSFRLCNTGLMIPKMFYFVPATKIPSINYSFNNYLCANENQQFPIEINYKMNEECLTSIKNTYSIVMDTRNSFKNLDIAIERFNKSYVANNSNDKLIDQIIAFESLYLKDEPELRLKLALRSAYLLAKDEYQKRKEIFNNITKAYKLRNDIVHGNKKVHHSDLIDILPATEEYLRNSIRIFLSLLHNEYKFKRLKESDKENLALLDENILSNGMYFSDI